MTNFHLLSNIAIQGLVPAQLRSRFPGQRIIEINERKREYAIQFNTASAADQARLKLKNDRDYGHALRVRFISNGELQGYL